MCDVSLDEGFSQLDTLTNIGEKCRLHIIDHHEWADNVQSAVSSVSDTFIVKQNDEWEYNSHTVESKSTVKLLYEYFVEENNHTFSSTIEDRVNAVSLADTWETERQENGKEEFIHKDSVLFLYSADQILESYTLAERTPANKWGFNDWCTEFMTDESTLDTIKSDSDTYYQNRSKEADYICSSDDLYRQYCVNGISVGVSYGQTDPNILARQMFDSGSDIACLIRPNTGISFRSNPEQFSECHTLAGYVGGGGGHEHASGTTVKYLQSFSDETFTELYGQNLDLELLRIVDYVSS
jgi:oligoribonuclease NrnB/cAMP/cGMP phosphodiesterase (DHH superfamily)